MDGYWELPRPFTSHARSEVREWIDAIAPYYPENFFQMTFRGQPLMGVPENTGDGHGRWQVNGTRSAWITAGADRPSAPLMTASHHR